MTDELYCIVESVEPDSLHCVTHDTTFKRAGIVPTSCDNTWITHKRLAATLARAAAVAPPSAPPEPPMCSGFCQTVYPYGFVAEAGCPVHDVAPPETTAPTATTHGFHQRDGWYFKRLENGAVRIRKTMSSHPASAVEVEQIIPAEEWVSVVAHLSAFTDGAVAYGVASELHHGPQ